MTWTRSGNTYATGWSDDIALVVTLDDHRWTARVLCFGEIVHMSEHSGQDEAFDAAMGAAARARHLRRFMPVAPGRAKPDPAP